MADPKTGQLAEPEAFAVVQDPNAPVPPKDIGYVKTPRDIARDEMAKRAQRRRVASDVVFKPDVLNEDGSITPDVTAAPPAPEPEPEQRPFSPDTRDTAQITAAEASTLPTEAGDPSSAPSAPPSAPVQAAPEEERELIVDGKRIKVPLSKILDAGTRTLQKEVTADMRLAAATELLRSAQERQTQAHTPAPATQPQPAAPSTDDDALLARQLQFGTEDEARSAIAKLRNAAPAITPQQIDAYVQQKLAQALPEHAAFNEANAWLRSEHKQIVGDPDLKFLFDTKEDQARKAGDRRPYKELYAAIAGELSTKFNLKRDEPTPTPQPIETTQASDRLTRKAQSPRPITGASGRLEAPSAPQRAPTVSDFVTRQRQLRGLQPLQKQGQ